MPSAFVEMSLVATLVHLFRSEDGENLALLYFDSPVEVYVDYLYVTAANNKSSQTDG